MAEQRNNSFEEDNNWDNQQNDYGVDPEERNFVGLMGELAFAKHGGLTVDTEEYEKTDGGEDFNVELDGSYCTLDVKTVQKGPRALFVKEGCASADYYVLGHLDEPRVEFLGMASREQLLSTPLSETPYDHRNHEIPVTDLNPIPEPEALNPVGSN
jgi:hypothetical protein